MEMGGVVMERVGEKLEEWVMEQFIYLTKWIFVFCSPVTRLDAEIAYNISEGKSFSISFATNLMYLTVIDLTL